MILGAVINWLRRKDGPLLPYTKKELMNEWVSVCLDSVGTTERSRKGRTGWMGKRMNWKGVGWVKMGENKVGFQ